MSTPNLDARYVKPADVDSKIAAQAVTDAGQYSSKYSFYFNVKDYGATGNGSTDDTATIQSAITAAQTNGGAVYFPSGTYLVSSSLSITASIAIIGAQKRKTTIKLANGANTNVFEIGTEVVEIEFRSIQVDGNKANNTSGIGVSFTDYTTDNTYKGSGQFNFVSVKNCASHGIYAGRLRSTGYAYNLIAGGNGGDGIHVEGYDWILTACNFGGNSGSGIYINSGNIQVSNTTCYSNLNNLYIYTSTDRAIFSNMVLESSVQDNVIINAANYSKTIRVDGSFGQCGTSSTGTYSHFNIISATQINVSGHIWDQTGASSPINPKYIFNNDNATGCFIHVGGLHWKPTDYTTAFCSNNILSVTGIENRIVRGVGAITSISGATVTSLGSIWPILSCATNANSSVAVNFGHLPRKWKTFDIYVRGANLSASTGSVALRSVYSQRISGDDLTTSSSTGSVQLATAAAINVRQDTLLASQITVVPLAETMIRIDRRGVTGSDGDTLGGAWGIEAIELRWRA